MGPFMGNDIFYCALKMKRALEEISLGLSLRRILLACVWDGQPGYL